MAILKISAPAIITSREVIIAGYDAILGQSDQQNVYNHQNNYTNDSYLSNLYERNEHFLKETSIENTTNIGTIDEFVMRNQRTCVANQDKNHRLEDLCNDLSLSNNRNWVGEASECSRSKLKFTYKYGSARRDREPSRLQCKKLLECSKRVSQVENALSVIFCTVHYTSMQWKTFYPMISEFTLQLDCVGKNTCSAYCCVTHAIYIAKEELISIKTDMYCLLMMIVA